ncbi:MAG: serine/threonine-protein kinase [Planctomycetota bacterium]
MSDSNDPNARTIGRTDSTVPRGGHDGAPTDNVHELGRQLAELELVDTPTFNDVCTKVGNLGDTAPILTKLEQIGKLTPFQVKKIQESSPAGLRFDEYVLIEKLGEGGMGEVFRAHNLMLGRQEAIKTIIHLEGADEALFRRFQQEARVLARLEHPAIVPIYKVGRFSGIDYIAMKFVAGDDLKAKVKQAKESGVPIAIETACRWISDAADALGYAHEQNVIHRDIKPGNLMITRGTGRLIVLDLGIARLADPQTPHGTGLTMQARGLGTPEFMPPEQWADARAVTPSSDFYALGCTLFYLLTGTVPFKRARMVELMRAHATEPVPKMHELRPDVPPELDAVLAKMMAKNPDDRYRTGPEVVEALRPFAEEAAPRTTTSIPKEPFVPPPSRTSRRQESSKQKRGAWPLIVIAVVAIAGFGGWWFLTNKSPALLPVTTDYQKEFDIWLESYRAKHADVWPEPSAFLAAVRVQITDQGITDEVTLASRKGRVEQLTVDRREQLKAAAIPPWLIAYQQENQDVWPKMHELSDRVREWNGGTLPTSNEIANDGGKLALETNMRKRHKLRDAANAWLSQFRKQHANTWSSFDDLVEVVGGKERLDRIRSQQDFRSLQETVADETDALEHPFENLNQTPLASDWVATAMQSLKAILSLHASPPDPAWNFQGGFFNAENQPIQKAKVHQSVRIWCESSREANITIVSMDEWTLSILKVDVPCRVGDKLTLSTKFTEPGLKRFTLYATAEPLVETSVTPILNVREKAVQKLFSRTRIFQRLNDSLRTGAPMPGIPPHPNQPAWAHAVIELLVEP